MKRIGIQYFTPNFLPELEYLIHKYGYIHTYVDYMQRTPLSALMNFLRVSSQLHFQTRSIHFFYLDTRVLDVSRNFIQKKVAFECETLFVHSPYYS